MTKTIANKCIKVLLENIHSVDDMLKAIDLIERLSKYTEEAKTDTKSKPIAIKNEPIKNEPIKNEAPLTAEPVEEQPAIIADKADKAEANNEEDEEDEEDEEETGGLFDDDDYTISVTPLVTSEPITAPTSAEPVVRRISPENKPDNELRDLREKEIASFMPPLPEVPEEQRMSLEPPAKREAPTDEKIEKLMEEGRKAMSEPAWQTFEASYRRNYDYEHLRNMWAYFHETQPADWGELPKEAA